MADCLLNRKDPELDKISSVSNAVDSIALLSQVANDITTFRREQIKPALREECRQLCSADIAPSEWLFGEDLPKRLREIKETNRLAQEVAINSTGKNYHGYTNRQYHAPKRFHGSENKGKNQEQMDKLLSREKLLSQLEETKQSVSTFEEHLANKSQLKNECDNFRACRAAQFYETWRELTHDQEILRDIRGANIECNTTPQQHKLSRKQFSEDDTLIIESAVEKLLSKGVIEPAQHEQGEILSNIFTRPKTDGTYRLILNLKEFNKHVSYCHFKMDTLNTIVNLMSLDCYMASLDLKDAYYSIPVMKEHRKYLRYLFNGRLYQFTRLPMDYTAKSQNLGKI